MPKLVDRAKTYHAVVARFEEDVSWVRQLTFSVTVYNKGASVSGVEDVCTVIARPNLGRESETYLAHIIEHYDALPDFLVLLQGNPFDHCHGVLDILRDPPAETELLIPLSSNYKHEILTGDYNWPGFQQCLQELALLLGLQPHSALIYATGAQYVVPKERILARPKSFYEKLITRVAHSALPLEGWAMERLWPYLFGERNKAEEFSFDTYAFPNAREEALSEAQDLVCITTAAQFVPENWKDLVDTYFQYKYANKEDDVALFLPECLVTHRALLLQHWLPSMKDKIPPAEHFKSRGVPVFTLPA